MDKDKDMEEIVIKEEKEDVVIDIKCNKTLGPDVLETIKEEKFEESSSVFIHTSAHVEVKQEEELIISDVAGTSKEPRNYVSIVEKKNPKPHEKVFTVLGKTLKLPAGLKIKTIGQNEPHKAASKSSCRICHQRVQDLSQHIQVHFVKLSSTTFRCLRCSKVIYSQQYLDYHTCLIECGICHKSFSNSTSLKSHKKAHTKAHECNECPQKFYFERELIDHKNLHKFAVHLKCQICDHQFSSKHSLDRHMAIHNGNPEGEFSCNVCDYKTHFISRLKRHKEIHGKTTIISLC